MVDTQGLPHAVAVTTADVTDRKGALMAFMLHQDSLSEVRNVLVDGGYTGEPFADETYTILGASVQVAKRIAYFCRHTSAMGSRALFRMARKMSASMEKLRKKAQYQLAVRFIGVFGSVNEEIVNRL